MSAGNRCQPAVEAGKQKLNIVSIFLNLKIHYSILVIKESIFLFYTNQPVCFYSLINYSNTIYKIKEFSYLSESLRKKFN